MSRRFQKVDEVSCFGVVFGVLPVDVQSCVAGIRWDGMLFRERIPSSPKSLTSCTADFANVSLPA